MSHSRRLLLIATAAVTVTAGLAQPASAAGESVSLAPTSWAYTDSATPTTAHVNQAGDAPVGTTTDTAGKKHTSRSYFTFDLTRFKGEIIQSTFLYTIETKVNDCTATAPVEMWRTGPVKATTTWKSPPAEIERLFQRSEGAGAPVCPGYLGFQLDQVFSAAVARGDRTLTLELRIAQAGEGDPRLGRTMQKLAGGLNGNHPPVVTDLKLRYPAGSCGTPAKHPTAGNSPVMQAKVTDADPNDHPSVYFGVWPADHPDQRKLFGGVSAGSDGVTWAGADLSAYADGTLLAWSAYGTDYTDNGPWGRTCYLTVDKTPPADPPVVSSKTFVEGNVASGGQGVPGKFRFDASPDHDVVAFAWRDWMGYYGQVDAKRGGTGVLDYTPKYTGPQSLYVSSVDAAGNRGPEREYRFWVRATAPYGSVDVAGVGLPSTVSLTAPVDGTTEMSYQLPGAAEVRLPVTNGKASGPLTFTDTGYFDITLRSYKGSKLIGQNTLSVSVSDEPDVQSAEFDVFTDQVQGKTGSFTFKPRRAGVVAYEYSVGDTTARIDAAPDGSAVLPYTADTPGYLTMLVTSVSADGTRSQPAQYSFDIIAVTPTAYASELHDSPRRDGVGLPLQIELDSQLPDLTGFVYRFNGGPETAVPSNGNWYANITVTPEHAGDNTLTFQAVRADGSHSPEATFTFQTFSGPIVTWSPSGDVIADHPVTLTFRAALPGATQFAYTLPGVDGGTVPVGADGTATVTYTPTSWGLDTIQVKSLGADGTASEERWQYIYVLDDHVSVYGNWNESYPTGGPGTPGTITFYTQLFPNVVEYHYHVDNGPTVIVPAATDGTSTSTPFTPTHSGLTTLYAQQVLSSGEVSPVTEYHFLVGTATLVESAQYPASVWSGGAGQPGTFTFTAGADGVVSFDYHWEWDGATQNIAATDGRATLQWTPTEWGQHYLYVTGRRADGTTTDQTTYYVLVNP